MAGEETDTVLAPEAAEMLGISTATLTRLVQRGELTIATRNPVLRRQRLVFRRADLVEYKRGKEAEALKRGEKPQQAE